MFYYAPYHEVSSDDLIINGIRSVADKERIDVSAAYIVGYDDGTDSIEEIEYRNCIVKDNSIPSNRFYVIVGKGFIRCDEKIIAIKEDTKASKGPRFVFSVAILSRDYNDKITISGQENFNDIEIEFITNFNKILRDRIMFFYRDNFMSSYGRSDI